MDKHWAAYFDVPPHTVLEALKKAPPEFRGEFRTKALDGGSRHEIYLGDRYIARVLSSCEDYRLDLDELLAWGKGEEPEEEDDAADT